MDNPRSGWQIQRSRRGDRNSNGESDRHPQPRQQQYRSSYPPAGRHHQQQQQQRNSFDGGQMHSHSHPHHQQQPLHGGPPGNNYGRRQGGMKRPPPLPQQQPPSYDEIMASSNHGGEHESSSTHNNHPPDLDDLLRSVIGEVHNSIRRSPVNISGAGAGGGVSSSSTNNYNTTTTAQQRHQHRQISALRSTGSTDNDSPRKSVRFGTNMVKEIANNNSNNTNARANYAGKERHPSRMNMGNNNMINMSNSGSTTSNVHNNLHFGNNNNTFAAHAQQQQQPRRPSPPKNNSKKRTHMGNQSKCKIPGHDHIWKLCPNNPNSKNFNGIDHRTMTSHQAFLSAQQQGQQQQGVAAKKGGAKKPSPRNSNSSGGILKQPPAVLPSSRTISTTNSGGGGSSSSMFNTTNSARPIPRKTPSENTLGGGGGESNGSSINQIHSPSNIIPKKRKFQRQESQDSSHSITNNQGHHSTSDHLQQQQQQTSTASSSSSTNHNHHQHIQSQQTDQKGQIQVSFQGGHWRRRAVPRAPSGSNAMPLKFGRSGRLVAGGSKKSVFSSKTIVQTTTEGCEENNHGDDERSMEWSSPEKSSRDDSISPEKRGGPNNGNNMKLSRPAGGTAAVSCLQSNGDELYNTDSESDGTGEKQDKKRPAKKTKARRRDPLGLEDSSSSSSSSDDDGDDDSSDDNLPMAMKRKKRSNDQMNHGGGLLNGSGRKKSSQQHKQQQLNQQAEGIDVRGQCSAGDNGEEEVNRKKDTRGHHPNLPMPRSERDDNSSGNHDKDERRRMEVEDANIFEFENDFFNLVEQSIQINNQWNKQTEEILSFDRKESPDNAHPGDTENNSEHSGPENSHKDYTHRSRRNEGGGDESPHAKDSESGQKDNHISGKDGNNGTIIGLTNGNNNIEADTVIMQSRENTSNANDKELPRTSDVQSDNDKDVSSLKENRQNEITTIIIDKSEGKEKKKQKKRRKASKNDEATSRNVKKNKQGADTPWTEEEKRLYREGVEMHPNDWGKIASDFVKTKSVIQVRQYAKKSLTQDSLKRQQGNPQDSFNQNAMQDDGEIFSLSDTASASSCGDEGDVYPAFLTCNKCFMVFGDTHEAWAHEENCTCMNGQSVVEGGRVFDDKDALVQFMIDYYDREGGVPKEKDLIYYRPVTPSERNSTNHQNNAGSSRNNARSPPADAHGKADEKINANTAGDYTNEQGEEDDEAADMNLVKHLCSTTINPSTGLPTQKLTVMCGHSETLYDFRVDIKQSSIPNAGHGAFLTYLGARVLNESAQQRSTRLMEEHTTEGEWGTHLPLSAETLGGRTMNVKLIGDNLHYNDNNIYWSKERARKYATMESFDENEVKCDIHDEVKRLRNTVPDGEGIGFLGINKESDYRRDDSKQFWSYPNGMFELGRYGPHRPEDRKIRFHFDFKNFIHNYEPSEWSYEVPEQMMNHPQMIDITDDTTGEVHSLARQHTPPYVNEVGHNSKLHRNVLIRDKNDRSVYYYVGIDEEHALTKGETVELLVDYGNHYEQVRERKGYGRFNASEHVGGDEDDAARLSRNFHEREEVENDISTMNIYEMFHLIEFLSNEILDPVNESIQRICSEEGRVKSVALSSRDIIARRRLHWIGEKLDGRFKEFEANEKIDNNCSFMTSIRHSLQQWRFVSMPSIYHQLNHDHRVVLQNELTEEMFYQARSRLPSPLNETVWCKLAVDLMKNVSLLLAQYMHCYPGPLDMRKQFLAEKLLGLAEETAVAVRKGANATIRSDTDFNSLCFKSPKRIIKKKYLVDGSNERMTSLYDDRDIIRFGTAAAMADIQAYYDAVDLCGINSYFTPGKNKRISECERSIVSMYDPVGVDEANKRSPQHRWMARSVDSFKRGAASVSEQWYIENQVLLVVDALASTCVDWEQLDGSSELYSLEKLCAKVSCDLDRAKRATTLGAVSPAFPAPEIIPAIEAEEKTNESRNTRRQTRRQVYSGQDDRFPTGWIRKSRQRASSHHVDNYWGHPELPQGLVVRSKTGVQALVDYARENNVGVGAAYEEFKGVKKYFNRQPGLNIS